MKFKDKRSENHIDPDRFTTSKVTVSTILYEPNNKFFPFLYCHHYITPYELFHVMYIFVIQQ